MTAKTLMVVGTASSVGKSVLVAALCRIFAQDGMSPPRLRRARKARHTGEPRGGDVRVAPFKAQNMSLNSYVTRDGKEIGRAQAVQAQAAGIEPTVEMNPILLKPEAEARSQVVVMGKPWATLQAGDYYRHKSELWRFVTGALDSLRAQYDLVIIEGAGSAVEPNLKASDIVNLSIAKYAQAPVLLAGDIDRGGVFGALLGTLELLSADERALIKGFIINKFRGDLKLLQPALTFIEQRTGIPVLGVVPYLRELRIAEEDSVALDLTPLPDLTPGPSPVGTARQERGEGPGVGGEAAIDIAVVRLPHISNFDDFDALALEENVRVRFVSTLNELAQPHAIILPGTKSTIADLEYLYRTGLAAAITARARHGRSVVGICGGYQMLGLVIRDPLHVESDQPEVSGLHLLPVETLFEAEKATEQVRARITAACGFLQSLQGQTVDGYEIHMGRTRGAPPFLQIIQRGGHSASGGDGVVDESGRIWGTYLHGIFDNANFRRAWLNSLGQRDASLQSLHERREREYDRLADAVRTALDMDAVRSLLG